MSQMGFMDVDEDFDRAPDYERPTWEEVQEGPKNGLKAVGSFSGCGGSSAGMKMAGWEIEAAVEFIPEAATTYRANHPGTHLFERDIRELDAGEILDAIGMDQGDLDCFEGSPPCSSFSSAGAGSKDWGKTKKYSDGEQRTDDLFFEWTRVLEGLEPKSFVAENVPGLIKGLAIEEYAYKITKQLSELGYHVHAKVLNAANYGTPQERERLIFVGFRRDLDVPAWSWPKPTTTTPHTVRQALASAGPQDPEIVAASSMEGKAVGRTWQAVQDARAKGWAVPDYSKLPCARCEQPVGVGGTSAGGHTVTEWSQGGLPLKATCADGEKAQIVKDYFLLVVPELDRPSPTLTATGSQVGAASVVHPTECRKFTPEEALAISGFPRGYVLTGTREQQYERVGRAVPPPLYRAVGNQLATWLKAA